MTPQHLPPPGKAPVADRDPARSHGKARDKPLIISTLITLALMIGSVVTLGILADRTTEASVAFANNERAAALIRAANELAVEQDQKIVLTPAPLGTEERAVEALRAKNTDLVLADDRGIQLHRADGRPASLEKLLADAAAAPALQSNAQELGVSVESLTAGSTVTPVLLEGDQERNSMATVMGFIFSFLFYMSALIFGMPIANSVVEESRTG